MEIHNWVVTESRFEPGRGTWSSIGVGLAAGFLAIVTFTFFSFPCVAGAKAGEMTVSSATAVTALGIVFVITFFVATCYDSYEYWSGTDAACVKCGRVWLGLTKQRAAEEMKIETLQAAQALVETRKEMFRRSAK